MTVNQYYGAFYADTKINEKTFPNARILALLNEAQADFVDRTLCLKADYISRLTMVDKQTYSITGDKLYLDGTSGYLWTVSGVATEYYCQATGGVDPSLSEPDGVHVDGTKYTEGTAGSLEEYEYAYDDNDTLGYGTVYIYASDDPDDEGDGFVLLEPGGFEVSDMLRPIYFRYDGVDITDNELFINQIGIGDSTKAIQCWAYWNGTIYLDPVPSSSKTIQLWYAKVPAVLTLSTEIPDVDGVYHSALLHYILWRYYDGAGEDIREEGVPGKAKDNERMYLRAVAWGFGRTKTRDRTAQGRVINKFP